MSDNLTAGEGTKDTVETNRLAASERPDNSDWTFVDVVVVFGACMFVPGIIGMVLQFVFGDSKAITRLMMYSGNLWYIFMPLWWIRWRYGLTRVALGIRETRNSFTAGLLGALIASAYTALFRCVLLRPEIPVAGPAVTSRDILMLPVSIDGFLLVVLGPISEEILYRGFIYPYFRRKLGTIAGQVLQALLFSLIHAPFDPPGLMRRLLLFAFRFVAALIFGVLYQRIGSLYPSMVSHGIMNYVELTLPFLFMKTGV